MARGGGRRNGAGRAGADKRLLPYLPPRVRADGAGPPSVPSDHTRRVAMSKPILAALVLAAAAPVASAAAQDFAYKPGTQQYRLEQTLSQTQEMQGQMMDMSLTSAQFISLAAAPQGGGLGLTYTIDSVRFDTPTGSMAAMAGGAADQRDAQAKALTGKQVVATASPLGAISSIGAADTTDAAARSVAPGFRTFLIAFPSAAVQSGMTWTDTVSATMNNMGIDVKSTAINTYTVTGDTTAYGRRAWMVAHTGTLTLSGSGNTQGADVTLSGTGSSTGTSFVGVDGVYLGGTTDQTQSMTVDVPAAGMSIPITNKVATKIVPVE